MRLHTLFVSSLVVFALTGCAFGPSATPSLNVTPDAIHGTIVGGQQPVLGATLSIYEVGSTAYGTASTTAKATTTSSLVDGSFAFGGAGATYTCTASNTPMYIVATGGTPGGYSANASLALMALIPQCAAGKSTSLDINEVTTAAAIVAAGQFMGTGLGSSNAVPQIGATCTSCATGTYNKGLVAAFSNTYPMLVNNTLGTAVTSGTTNSITITRESAKLNSIANVLAACVNSSGATSTSETTTTCGQLFTGVNAKSSTPRPFNTIQAGLEMALYPYYNVAVVCGLGSPTSPFVGLSSAPGDWTIGISYTTTSFGLGLGYQTSTSIDIDASGNVWFPTNKSSGAGVGAFNPSTVSFTGPVGQYVAYPQYMAIDTSSSPLVWMSDMNGSTLYATPVSTGSTNFLSGSGVFGGGGPLFFDSANNLVLAGSQFGNSSSASSVYIAPSSRSGFNAAANASVNGLFNAIGPNVYVPTNSFIVADSSSSGACQAVLLYSIANGSQVQDTTGSSNCLIGGLAQDKTNNDNIVSNSNGYLCSTATPNCVSVSTLSTPENLAFDGARTLWIANSGNASISAVSLQDGASPLAVTLIGSGYIHNAANGSTLVTPYGLAIDASGNVWVSNASCLGTSSGRCQATSFTLSEIVGVAAPTITPFAAQTNTTLGTKPTN